MIDITELSLSEKMEIASYIKEDTLDIVNKNISSAKPRVSFYTKYGKRFLDILIALVGFIISLPFNMIIAIVTFFDVGFPIIFKQQRIGLNQKRFVIYKFRNMTNAVDINGELLPPSERVTKWGRFLRKTSLDELLNFVSILKGDMSIIGPRPLLDYYAERMNNYHKGIYLVKPGLECPTLYKVDHELSWQERLDNYVWYAENCSFWIDCKLCFRIVQIALDHRSTKKRADAEQGGLLGYDANGNIIHTKAVPQKYIEQFLEVHGYENFDVAVKARVEKIQQKNAEDSRCRENIGEYYKWEKNPT